MESAVDICFLAYLFEKRTLEVMGVERLTERQREKTESQKVPHQAGEVGATRTQTQGLVKQGPTFLESILKSTIAFGGVWNWLHFYETQVSWPSHLIAFPSAQSPCILELQSKEKGVTFSHGCAQVSSWLTPRVILV